MHIALVTTSFPLTKESASGPFILRLIKHFPANLVIEVITPCTNKPTTPFLNYTNISIHCFRYAPWSWQTIAHQPGGVPVAIRQHRWLILLLPFFLFSLFFNCLKVARKANIIHAQWSVNGAIAAMAGWFTHTPVITTLRGSDVSRTQHSALDRYLLRLCLQLNNYVVSVSESIHDQITHDYPQFKHKLVTIPNGVEEVFLNINRQNRAADNVMRIVSIGNLIASKGMDTILKAFAKLNVLTKIELYIIGDGPEKASLESLTRQLEIQQRVVFIGQVNPEQIPEQLSNADIFVFASQSEGRPNAVLEAMASGLPVIASRIDGVCEVVQEDINGLLFDPGNADELALCLQRLYINATLRETLGKAAREFIVQNQLTWQACARRYVEIYTKLFPKTETPK